MFCGLGTSAWAIDPSRRISQYAHSSWRTQDGVFASAPTVIAQTGDGYIWIGTQSGLLRFDGVRFVPWIFPEGSSHLPSQYIVALMAASDGSLWIGTTEGLAHLKNNARLQSYSHSHAGINEIIEDSDGRVWVARYAIDDGKGPLCRASDSDLECYGKSDGIATNYATVLAQDSAKNFWVGTDALYRWKPGSTTVYFSRELSRSVGLPSVLALAAGRDGAVYAGLWGSPKLGLQRFFQGNWRGYVVPGMNGPELDASELFVDRNNSLWVGTRSQGIYRVSNGTSDHFRAEDGLTSNSIEQIYQDHEGNIWVTTSKGLDSFRDLPVASFSIREGLSSDGAVSVLSGRNGTIWIGNDGGLDSLHNGEFSTIRTHHGLPGEAVSALFQDHAGRMWVGIDNSLAVYENGTFSEIRRSDGGDLGIVTALTEDTDQNIWAIVITTVQKHSGRLFCIKNRRVVDELGPPQIDVPLSLASDPTDGIWVGLLSNDLLRWRRGQVQRYHFDPGTTQPGIFQLYAQSDGSILGATQSGLIGWHGESQLLSLTTRNGLPCNRVFTFVEDKEGTLWLYAPCGLLAIAKDELQKWWQRPETVLKLKLFDVLDGAQPGAAPYRPASSVSPDGRVWFVNSHIVQMVDPHHIAQNALPPMLRIEDIVADRRTYSPHQDMKLPALMRDLEIDYTALSFVMPQKVRFRYKLEGHDRDWQDPGTRRQAFYNDLRPGQYRFRVIACNNDGLWNETGAALDFSISPAWFQTKWFLVICVLSGLLLIWGFFRLRMQQMQKSLSARFNERLAERTRMARELHDTFLQTLQGRKLVADDALEKSSDPIHMQRAMEQLSAWLERAIHEGRAALNSLRTPTTQTNDLAEAFKRATDESRMQSRMQVSFSVTGHPKEMHPVVRDEIYRIGYEAIRNAYTHSNGNQLEVSLRYGRDLAVCVSDDGVGIDPSVGDQGKNGHFGLQGMRERAVRIGGKLSVVSSPNSGTEVTIVVPGGIVFAKSRMTLLKKVKNAFRRTARTFHGD